MKTSEGFLKHDKMTEKEFLMEFVLRQHQLGFLFTNAPEAVYQPVIDEFLAEFHETYVPITRWIVKGEAVYVPPGPNDCPKCGAIAHPGYRCDDYDRPIPVPDTQPLDK